MGRTGGVTRAVVAAAALGLVSVGCAGVPRNPQVLPAATEDFAAPYAVVWDATLESLGVVKVRQFDPARGRVETEPFTFAFPIGSGIGGGTQVIHVSLAVTVTRADAQRTQVAVRPRVHAAFFPDVFPGPTNSPSADLLARIRSRLGLSQGFPARPRSAGDGPARGPREPGGRARSRPDGVFAGHP